MTPHVERMLHRRVALLAVGAQPTRKYPIATQVALDAAVLGACGYPDPERAAYADRVDLAADWAEAEGHAAAPALRDLADVMRRGDREACARGLADAWRAQNPFRVSRGERGPCPGDPTDALLAPHVRGGERDDVSAASALDDAARCLAAYPTALARHAGDLERLLTDDPEARTGSADDFYGEVPYTHAFAATALALARRDMSELLRLRRKYAGPRSGLSDYLGHAGDVRPALAAATEWVRRVRRAQLRGRDVNAAATEAEGARAALKAAFEWSDGWSTDAARLHGDAAQFRLDMGERRSYPTRGADAREMAYNDRLLAAAERVEALARAVHNALSYVAKHAESLEFYDEDVGGALEMIRDANPDVAASGRVLYAQLVGRFPELRH